MQFNVSEALQHTNEHSDRIIATLGACVQPDADGYLTMVAPTTTKDVLVECDLGWGNVTVVFPAEGHLILCVNYGDDGYRMFSPTIVDSCVELVTGLPEAIRAMLDVYECVNDDSFTVNKLSEYSISEAFNC